MLALLLFLLLAGAIVRPRTVVLFSHSLLNQIIKKPKPTPLFYAVTPFNSDPKA